MHFNKEIENKDYLNSLIIFKELNNPTPNPLRSRWKFCKLVENFEKPFEAGQHFKNIVLNFLQLGSINPSVRTRQLGLFVNLGMLELTYRATLWIAKQLYNQYESVSMSISNMTIWAFFPKYELLHFERHIPVLKQRSFFTFRVSPSVRKR